MKIRQKLILVTGTFFLSVLGISSLAVWTVSQISALKQTVDQGTRLIVESSNVRGLLHDLLYGMFAPETYTLLKDLTYAPRPYATSREWTAAADKFRRDFRTFMALPGVKNMLRDSELRDKYNAALIVSDRAFEKIAGLNAKLRTLDASGIIGSSGLYQSIQSGNSVQVSGFFDDVRTTSYYLTNNFESFLDYFLLSLRAESELIQRRQIITFVLLSFFIGASAIFISVATGRRITRSIANVESTIRKVSSGDFSAKLEVTSDDEFGKLSDNLNLFIKDLKHNVDSILDLHRNVADAITGSVDLDTILSLVVESTVKETNADSAAILLIDGTDHLTERAAVGSFPWNEVRGTDPLASIFGKVARNGKAIFIRDTTLSAAPELDPRLPVRSLVVLPLIASKHTVGVFSIVRHRPDKNLTDLDFTSLSTFADYAALTIDNFSKYTELLERRQAEYLALQSQVHPHFLYNVLSGIIGLNRRGDRASVERTILALKGMLRYTIEHEEWTTVAEELEFIDQYCALQKIRFGDRLSVVIQCDDEATRYRIPKLILQPLVENAIIHGIEPLGRPGRLLVSVTVSNRDAFPVLSVTIEDDGIGFVPKPIERTRHVGLYNVRERLTLAYREASFAIESRPEGGTKVAIQLAGEELIR
jgi:sensor histidine kinase YesM